MLQQRLDLRSEQEDPIAEVVVQRLDPIAVAGEEERTRITVPNREGEHPVQAMDARRPPLLIRLQHDFGIGAGVELVPLGLEVHSQAREVVDLAIEDDDATAVRVRHRLVTRGREINDGEPAVPETDKGLHPGALTIWAPMSQSRGHLVQDDRGDRFSPYVEDSRNPAHFPTPAP